MITIQKKYANIEKIGGMEFNVEKIISLQPDVVLAQGSMVNSSAARTSAAKRCRNLLYLL